MRAPIIAFALVTAVVASGVVAAPRDVSVVALDESKPMGPIGVDVRLAAQPTLGVAVEVTVTARADAVGRLELEVRVDDPAALVIGGRSGPIDRAGSRSWIVTVVPMRESGGNLSVVVLGAIDGVAQAQSVSTKIRPAGAEPTVRALSNAPARPGSENLSLLPVEERF